MAAANVEPSMYNDDCPVCLENYEEKSLFIVTCGCGHMVCRQCTQQYLLKTIKEPHCMHCKRQWDKGFQFEMLTPTFVNCKYKKHRKLILFEREKVRLPDTQTHAEHYINRHLLETKLETLQITITNLTRKYEQMKRYFKIIKNCGIRDIGGGHRIVVGNNKSIKRTFIRKCPNDDCRGFLSTSYKCKLCNIAVCSTCLEIKDSQSMSPHTCDKANIASAAVIKKDTHPCPKCAVPIFKISGCDQMWCTQCQVAFSWKTGVIDTGRIHNPHFYQYMKQHKGTQIRVPGEQVCGRIPGVYTINRICRQYEFSTNKQPLFNTFMDLIRGYSHIQRVIIYPIRRRLRTHQDNVDLRIRYLANEIDDEYMMKYIMQRDNKRSKETSMLQVFELYYTVVTEQINLIFTYDRQHRNNTKLVEFSEYQKEAFYKEMINLISSVQQIRAYCNTEFQKISQNYNMKVHIIEPNFSVRKNMYRF